MAEYLTNTTDLTTVANAIRTKGGTSAQLSFPDGFASAIAAIPTGAEVIVGDITPESDINRNITISAAIGKTHIAIFARGGITLSSSITYNISGFCFEVGGNILTKRSYSCKLGATSIDAYSNADWKPATGVFTANGYWKSGTTYVYAAW